MSEIREVSMDLLSLVDGYFEADETMPCETSTTIVTAAQQVEEEKKRLAEYEKQIEETRMRIAAAEKKLAEDKEIEKMNRVQWKIDDIIFDDIIFDDLRARGPAHIWVSFTFKGCASFSCFGRDLFTNITVTANNMDETVDGVRSNKKTIEACVVLEKIATFDDLKLTKEILDNNSTVTALSQAIKPLLMALKFIPAVDTEDKMKCIAMRMSPKFVR